MTAQIQALPEDWVQRMAAGEVIDSPAAVVRELAENALDAGATRIVITLWLDQWRIQVADNGAGMTREDLQQAALSHCTSKLQSSDDLWNVRSLGFRGEALHSLAQLAELEIGSRPPADAAGCWVVFDRQGQPAEMEAVAIAPGTIVRVSQLFGDWLPRRQSLPSPAQQLRAIQQGIQHLALCHPGVTWQVYQGDAQATDPRATGRPESRTEAREWFSIWGAATAADILPQVLSTVAPQDLYHTHVPLAAPETALHLTLGLPDRCHRYRPDWVKVAVNGRVVRLPELEQAILQAFRQTLPRDRHPICFAHLHLPPQHIDWNRHPAKVELYLKALDDWRSHLQTAIQTALHQSPADLGQTLYGGRMGQLLRSAEAPGAYERRLSSPSMAEATGEAGAAASDGLTDGLTDPPMEALTDLRAIAQLHQMYIVAEHPTGIWLVEQHIAHERVLYEQLRDRWQLLPLDPPLILSQLSPAQVAQLQRIGLDIAPFGDDLWAVRTLPAPLHEREDAAAALLELSQGGDFESALVATACRTAIRNGTPLSLPAMQTLLNQWQATQSPRTCPHGRPIALQLQETSLSRFFRRHWVIGKSHGI